MKISSCPLTVPGLEQRKEDIPDLLKMIFGYLEQNGFRVGITDEAVTVLQNRKEWKGHVSELYTLVMRAVTRYDRTEIGVADIAERPNPGVEEDPEIQESEEERLKKLIFSWKGSKRELATRLGISERTLYRRIEQLLKDDPSLMPVSDAK